MNLENLTLEWDYGKNLINFEKHRFIFEDAITVFKSETVTFLDDRYNYGEERFITLGFLSDRLVVLVHTLRKNNVRIISLRKANEREKKTYYERLKKN